MTLSLLLPILFAYLLGATPFGLVLCALAGYGDIRKIGSGNIGATNVLRTGSKPLALATLLLDSGKGAIAVLLAGWIWDLNVAGLLLVGLAAITGHCFPIWLKFKGGKGVATTLGTLLAAVPFAGIAACGIWLLTALITRISSLSALIALLAAPFVCFALYGENPAFICAVITLLVWAKHKENIKHLLKGEESRIGKK